MKKNLILSSCIGGQFTNLLIAFTSPLPSSLEEFCNCISKHPPDKYCSPNCCTNRNERKGLLTLSQELECLSGMEPGLKELLLLYPRMKLQYLTLQEAVQLPPQVLQLPLSQSLQPGFRLASHSAKFLTALATLFTAGSSTSPKLMAASFPGSIFWYLQL